MSKLVYHVAIVGAGLGGLAAAIAISRAGHRVTVIEQAQQLGEVGYLLSILFDHPLIYVRSELVSKFHQTLHVYWRDGACCLPSRHIP